MRRYFWFVLILILLGASVLGREVLRSRARWRPVELVLAPPDQWQDITPQQRKGFGVLLKDCLEYGGGLAVVEQDAAIPARTVTQDQLQVRVARMGDLMRIQVVRRRAGRADQILNTGLETPQKAFGSLLAAMDLNEEAAAVMVPRNPEAFWGLAGWADWQQETGVHGALQGMGRIVQLEPECASAWLTMARISDLHLLTDPVLEIDAQTQCDADFQRALDLAPHYPRAVTSYARFRTDIGNQRGALDLLFATLRMFPRVPRLYEAVAYAARNAGLLEGATLALRQRDRILGLSRGEAGLTENTYLYVGDLATFEAVLGPGSAREGDSVRDFYRGYARLLQGDRGGAGRYFARAYTLPSGVPQFETLARVYHLGLQNRNEAALVLLRQLWADRVPLRVPDGEYTFKLAEAFGFLGSPGEAQSVATRAFAQGFGCTRWYEQSPFLAGIRSTPRWNGLQQHLQERQMLVASTYPPGRFHF